MDPRLVIVKCECLDDWYTIELAEHDGREWLESTGRNSMVLRYSGRISDACVEGTSTEMLAIADAIERRASVSFKRCEVRISGDRAFFRSPRNSQRDGVTSLECADELATQIRRELGTVVP